MFLGLSSSIQTLNAVAIGDKAADLVLENCSLVNVYTGEILPETQVAISKDRIAYVGEDASHTKGKKTVVINLEKKYFQKHSEQIVKGNLNNSWLNFFDTLKADKVLSFWVTFST